MDELRVGIWASDAFAHAGLDAYVRALPGTAVLGGRDIAAAEVVVLAAGAVDQAVLTVLRRLAAGCGAPVLLLADTASDEDLIALAQLHVVALLPRSVPADQLARRLRRAAALGPRPRVTPAALAAQTSDLRRRVAGSDGAELSDRELDVLRLLADGCDTTQVAVRLGYSDRTVKNIIHAVTTRLGLRNRPHAVAHALRCGLI